MSWDGEGRLAHPEHNHLPADKGMSGWSSEGRGVSALGKETKHNVL